MRTGSASEEVLPKLEGVTEVDPLHLVVEPISLGFAVFPDAKVPACIA